MCLAASAMHYIEQCCSGFVSCLTDTWDKGKATVDDVSIVQDYSDVFPKDLHGVPPERHIEFRIDLVPGAAQIAKERY